MTTDRYRLLQRLAFIKSRHINWDIFPANTMAYDDMMTRAVSEALALFFWVVSLLF